MTTVAVGSGDSPRRARCLTIGTSCPARRGPAGTDPAAARPTHPRSHVACRTGRGGGTAPARPGRPFGAVAPHRSDPGRSARVQRAATGTAVLRRRRRRPSRPAAVVRLDWSGAAVRARRSFSDHRRRGRTLARASTARHRRPRWRHQAGVSVARLHAALGERYGAPGKGPSAGGLGSLHTRNCSRIIGCSWHPPPALRGAVGAS